MADRRMAKKALSRKSKAALPEDAEDLGMGKPREELATAASPRRLRKPAKERWLLTRKTWRYMADAGRRLIPEGALNRPEDVPKIEAYFQDVCTREPRFLLWRKASYPGALGFRSHHRKRRKKGGSCRDRTAVSADEAEEVAPMGTGPLLLEPSAGGRFDLQRMRREFLAVPADQQGRPKSLPLPSRTDDDEAECREFVNTLQVLLDEESVGDRRGRPDVDYYKLVEQLRRHLSDIKLSPPGDDECPRGSPGNRDASRSEVQATFQRGNQGKYADMDNSSPHQSASKLAFFSRGDTSRSSPVGSSGSYPACGRDFDSARRTATTSSEDGAARYIASDPNQKMLLETLRRHFGKSTTREQVISDLLTDRKLLAKLFFDLQKTRGFAGRKLRSSPSETAAFWKNPTAHRFRPKIRESGRAENDLSGWRRSRSGGLARDGSPGYSPPPLIEVHEDSETSRADAGTQTPEMPSALVASIEEAVRRKDDSCQEEPEPEDKFSPPPRRRSSVDHDDVSPSVSDTIKRYLRMARKKSLDSDKQDRFKRVNYDRNLRNIRPKGEISRPGDDDGLHKGSQTEGSWVDAMRDLKVEDVVAFEAGPSSPPKTFPQTLISSGQNFLSHLLHGIQQSSGSTAAATGGGAMQKSKSSSSVVGHGSRLVAKKIWRARSKSQGRPAACAWTPQGNCTWTSVSGRQVTLGDTTLLQLSDAERLVLAQVALAKLRALNLGVAVRVPSDTVAAPSHKPKRRAHLLKRKALTTGFFDTGRTKDAADKEKENGGQVFGVPLSQCIENERGGRVPLRGSRSTELRRQSHHGSHASFTSLIETGRPEQSGSCESLMVGSVPGLLDSLSCSSSADILAASSPEEEPGVPNVVAACLNHLETYGLNTLGIFRVSASKKRVRQLREGFDCGKDISLGEDHCPHDVATLLKEYFRDLPEPLLSRDLYPAFIQTQKIRNRRLQYEALQHLVQLLPVANRDTLWALINFLAAVARHATDSTDSAGEWVPGNKMDSNNLATVFAPNILHCVKPGSGKDAPTFQDQAEDRIDVINVIRTMIEHQKDLFIVPAELLDEVYMHMMDSHADALDQLLNKRASGDELLDDLDTATPGDDSPSLMRNPAADILDLHLGEQLEVTDNPPGIIRRMWSREEFLHETAGMGGPDVAMRPRHKERNRERPTKKRWRDDTRRQHGTDSDSRRSSDGSAVSGDGSVITASLKIPVPGALGLDDNDIPFIEDNNPYCLGGDGHQQMTIGVVRTGSTTGRRRQHSASGSDSSQASMYPSASADSALGTSSVTTTVSSPPRHTTPPSLSSSTSPPPSWASSPPTSPDAMTNTSFLSDDSRLPNLSGGVGSKSFSSVAYQRQQSEQVKGAMVTAKEVAPVILQKVTFTSTSELRQIHKSGEQISVTFSKDFSSSNDHHTSKETVSIASSKSVEPLPKSASTSSVISSSAGIKSVKVEDGKSIAEPSEQRISDKKHTTSISSIGGAVMRSKTEDIERMLRIQKVEAARSSTPQVIEQPSSPADDKKKYAKRRYTDSRHQTRHIPDADTLKDASDPKEISASTTTAQRRSQQQQGPVYKRRELIASDPKKHGVI